MRQDKIDVLQRIKEQSHELYREEEKVEEARAGQRRAGRSAQRSARQYLHVARIGHDDQALAELADDISYALFAARREQGHARAHNRRVKSIKKLDEISERSGEPS